MKRSILITVILFATLCMPLLAQQAPDCNSCPCTVPSMLGTTLTTSSTHGSCSGNSYMIDGNRFARFHAIAGNKYEVSLCGSTENTMLFVATNTSVPAVILCDNDGCGTEGGASTLTFIPTSTGDYRLYVFNSACGGIFPSGTMMDLSITCSAVVAPPNDLPCNATALTVSSGPCVPVMTSNVGAMNAQLIVPGIGAAPNCNGAGFQTGDVWFTAVVPASGYLGLNTMEGTLCAGAIQLYTASSCNGTFTKIPGGCILSGYTGPTSEPGVIFNADAAGLAPGTMIYIRYWERNGNEPGSFEICAFDPDFADNDAACGATDLSFTMECQPLQVGPYHALPSTVPDPSCGNTTVVEDLWYQVDLPSPLPADFHSFSVNMDDDGILDMAMAWYLWPDPCDDAGAQLIACSSTGQISSAALPTGTIVGGESIYVRVWAQSGYSGTFSICTSYGITVANDDPCNAIQLDTQNGCLMTMGSNLYATTTGSSAPGTATNGIPVPSCNATTTKDVWYKVTVPSNGVLQLDMAAGTMTDAAFAVYKKVSGSCALNNLALQQVLSACKVNGSQQGEGHTSMPYVQLTGQSPGHTLYIRIWRQTGSDGSFGICARRTTIPTGDCAYTLSMTDDGGNGWNGSFVTLCLNGSCNDFSVNMGRNASISFGANNGDDFSMSYTAAGGSESENEYALMLQYSPLYSSGPEPPQGEVFSGPITCTPPAAPSGDCLGSIPLCSNEMVQPWFGQSHVQPELNFYNSSCKPPGSWEDQPIWLTLSFGPGTLPCSPIAFDLVSLHRSGTYYDFMVWGPFPAGSDAADICPLTQQPYRCNFVNTSEKGLAYNNALPTTASGNPKARHMVVNPGDVFMLYVSNWMATGGEFQIEFLTPDPEFQVVASDCTGGHSPAPPGSFAQLGCNVSLPARVVLAGPYDEGSELMNDDIRQLGLIPFSEPFTPLGYPQAGHGGGETTTSSILAITGNQAVVDWVRLELRDSSDPAQLVAVTHGLLRRDGTIVAANGSEKVTFIADPGDHYLVVRHRNHLGTMTATPIAMSATSQLIDMSSFSTMTFGDQGRKDINGTAVLWPGNANYDDRVKYTGADNDRDVVLGAIGSVVPTATVTGYHGTDFNLDGIVKYVGSENDRDLILQTIGGLIPTEIQVEQVP